MSRMMVKTAALTAVLAMVSALSATSVSAQDVAIRNAKLVIGDGSAPIDGGTVVVRGGKIVAAGAHVTPAHTEREIERPPGFARHNVFTVEQACTAQVTYPHRHLRQVIAFFPKTHFHIEGFIFVSLVSRECFDAAVLSGADIGVAQCGFQPWEKLH